MEKAGTIWPQAADREPRTANFWVPRSPLTASGEELMIGSVCVEVVETPERVEERLTEQFPLYRVAQRLGRLIGRGVTHEV